MAVVQLQSGDSITIGGVAEVQGTSGVQSVTINDNSTVIFRAGFNAGATDNLRLTGAASNFQFSLLNGNAILTSAIDGISITMPVGTNGTNITFDNGDTRLLVFNGTNVVLGAVVATPTPTALPPGPQVFSFEAHAAQAVEGTDYTFFALRTDDGKGNAAQSLTFNVQGDTNGGTVVGATTGLDFNVAQGNAVNFAAGSLKSAAFTVHLNNDSLVEGLEGIKVQLVNGQVVLATTTGLIADANTKGQTFTLTPGLDSVGSGTQFDLVGSEGSTSVIGQDTILVTENTANTFDFINGGAEIDTMRVLDAGSAFTFAPNFANIAVTNVENLAYTSVRGLFFNALNTTTWTGLENIAINVNSAATQTITAASTALAGKTTSEAIVNAGSGGVTVQGGGGGTTATLAVTAAGTGNVNVGQDGSNNSFTAATVTGGATVNITDTFAQELATVTLTGDATHNAFSGNANLVGSAITTVNVTGLNGGSHVLNITGPGAGPANPTVNLSNIIVTDFDVNAQNNITVNANGGNTSSIAGANGTILGGNGMGDISAGGNVVINSTNSYFWVADVNANGNSASVTLNATGGGFVLDDIQGPDLRTVNLNGGPTGQGFFIDQIDGTNTLNAPLNVNINGSTFAQINNVVEPASTPGGPGAVITAKNDGGVSITTQVGNNTQFNGSGDTGSDNVTFGANIRTNTFGGGDDNVTITVGTMGVGGTFDGGAGNDRLFMESNNAAKYSSAVTGNTNFEELDITSQTLGIQDIINLKNIGLTGAVTNVVSNLGPAAPIAELAKITFTGNASGLDLGNATKADKADTVSFDGQNIVLNDGDNGIAMAADFIASYMAVGAAATAGGVGRHYNATPTTPGSADVTLTSLFPGANLTDASFTITDKTNIGAPSIGAVTLTQDGQTATAGTQEITTITLTDVTVLSGQTIVFNMGGQTDTFTATADLTQAGGALGDALEAFFAGSAILSYLATSPGNNLVISGITFNGKQQNSARADLTILGGTGIQAGDIYTISVTQQGADPLPNITETFSATIIAAGNANDTITFDGQVVTLDGTENTNEAVAASFVAKYNANSDGGAAPTWLASVNAGINNQIDFVSLVSGARTNQTIGSFNIVDDTNVNTAGNPGVTINSITQGSVSDVILNQFLSGSSLTLNGLGATHTVNLLADGGVGVTDVLNLVTNAEGNHGTVNAPLFESVNINTDSDVAVATDILVLNDAALATVTLTGTDSLVLDTNSTAIRNVNGVNFGGTLTWQADANTAPTTAAPLTVTTGSGGSNINFSAITVGGLAPVVFNGGGGTDFVQLGGLGTARVNITLGGGTDFVRVGLADGGNDYSSILNFSASGASIDRLDFDGSVSANYSTGVLTVPAPAGDTDDNNFVVVRDQQLEPTAIFQDYLDQAAFGNATGQIHWFQFTSNGQTDTFVVKDNSAFQEFEDGVDQIIRLANFTGTLTAANFA